MQGEYGFNDFTYVTGRRAGMSPRIFIRRAVTAARLLVSGEFEIFRKRAFEQEPPPALRPRASLLEDTVQRFRDDELLRLLEEGLGVDLVSRQAIVETLPQEVRDNQTERYGFIMRSCAQLDSDNADLLVAVDYLLSRGQADAADQVLSRVDAKRFAIPRSYLAGRASQVGRRSMEIIDNLSAALEWNEFRLAHFLSGQAAYSLGRGSLAARHFDIAAAHKHYNWSDMGPVEKTG